MTEQSVSVVVPRSLERLLPPLWLAELPLREQSVSVVVPS